MKMTAHREWTFAAIMLLFGCCHRLAPTHIAVILQDAYIISPPVLSLSADVDTKTTGLTMWVTVGLRKGCRQANGDRSGSGRICQGAGGRGP